MKRALLILSCVTASFAASGAGCGPAEGEGEPEPKATLSAIQSDIFEPRCSATVCHGGPGPAADMNLQEDAYAVLVGDQLACTEGGSECDAAPGTKCVDGHCAIVSYTFGDVKVRVVPGNPEASLLYAALLDDVTAEASVDTDVCAAGVACTLERMPQEAGKLADEDIARIKKWIENGAKDD